MKRMKLNTDRIFTIAVTPNHQKVYLMNMEFDYSFDKLFSLTVEFKNIRSVFCRQMTEKEKQHSGLHFNTIQPNHKKRFEIREWNKVINSLLGNFHLDITEVKDEKKPKPRAEIVKKGKK